MTARSLVLALFTTIAAGCTGPTYDTGGGGKPPFVAESPQVYVAKVKNILVGLPPTDAEIRAVTTDPQALPGLIDGWMQLPEYQDKMMVFFELAFQQTQITESNFVDIIPDKGFGAVRGKQIPLLVQNARESFARTVLALTASGQPFTNAFTTKKLMMTPALMELYAYLDSRRADNRGVVTDLLADAYPALSITLEAAGGPIPIAQSVNPASPNFLHFYNSDLPNLSYPDAPCNGADPITINLSSFNLYQVIYGEIPPHRSQGVGCGVRSGSGAGSQLTPSDFNTWKLVTIRPPTGSEQRTQFFDLPTLRASNVLLLDTPRPGFFSTPAFFANWPTNQSNQMRVTVNQALIVATGNAIDGTDATSPATTPGLDMQHAAPGSACFSCHQLLDPTRSILSSTYSWFYNPQTVQGLINQPGLFAFQNVIAPMHTIDDFAKLLATHPLVPQAWVQKLCYYVNSAPCDPADPEMQRIVTAFASGHSWNGLIRDLLSSPITTNASETKTFATNGEVIAVARRDHLCAQLNNRLGFVDICQLDAISQVGRPSTIAQVVSGMPSDGYGRGATVPVLPNQPTLFYRGGLENICAQVSAMVIDAAVNPNQPGAKHWSSAQADVAIGDFVSTVMGMSTSDPRAAQLSSILTAHFTAAKAAGSTATDSLRSTFVAACLSPSFIGIGL